MIDVIVFDDLHLTGALMTLGLGMVGKFRLLRGRAILTPLLLVAAKTILLPILCKVVITSDASFVLHAYIHPSIH